MKLVILSLMLFAAPLQEQATKPNFVDGMKSTIQKYLGRPYVWGAAGIKSFDCSGFIWRVMYDNGILLKRTTARKFYMMLPPVPKEEQGNFGTIVFFDNLKHVGIVDSPNAFYHAQVSVGTNRSPMNSFWRQKIYGFRRLPPTP
ncbi:MAG TPA: NlpC/P60 family protein [Terriglobia bacterium]|nr:NlpC/P60 family protein [Terriglobia bacterium]